MTFLIVFIITGILTGFLFVIGSELANMLVKAIKENSGTIKGVQPPKIPKFSEMSMNMKAGIIAGLIAFPTYFFLGPFGAIISIFISLYLRRRFIKNHRESNRMVVDPESLTDSSRYDVRDLR